MLSKLKNYFKKEMRMPISEAFEMAHREKGIKVHGWTNFQVNGCFYYPIDNDINFLREGSYFAIEDEVNGVHVRFVHRVGMRQCRYCNKYELNREFNDKYDICNKCFKPLKKSWNKKQSTLEKHINAQIVANILSNT